MRAFCNLLLHVGYLLKAMVVVGHNHSAVGAIRVTNVQTLQETRIQVRHFVSEQI